MKMFHTHISSAAVFRRCKHGRSTKLDDESRDSANVLTGEHVVRNSEFRGGFSRMVLRVPLMYPLASAACAASAASCNPRSRR